MFLSLPVTLGLQRWLKNKPIQDSKGKKQGKLPIKIIFKKFLDSLFFLDWPDSLYRLN